jgi:hypothetical protein
MSNIDDPEDLPHRCRTWSNFSTLTLYLITTPAKSERKISRLSNVILQDGERSDYAWSSVTLMITGVLFYVMILGKDFLRYPDDAESMHFTVLYVIVMVFLFQPVSNKSKAQTLFIYTTGDYVNCSNGV